MALYNKSNTTNNIKNNTIVNRKEKRPGFPSHIEGNKKFRIRKNPEFNSCTIWRATVLLLEKGRVGGKTSTHHFIGDKKKQKIEPFWRFLLKIVDFGLKIVT